MQPPNMSNAKNEGEENCEAARMELEANLPNGILIR